VFNGNQEHAALTGRAAHLSALIRGYWTAFARMSDPNGRGRIRWPRTNVTPQQYGRFRADLMASMISSRGTTVHGYKLPDSSVRFAGSTRAARPAQS